MDKSIIVYGEGGYGIKFMGHALGKLMIRLEKEVAITYSYDAAMRGGNITAFITISDKPVENPLPSHPDIKLELDSKSEFVKSAVSLGSKKLTGMVVMGFILKKLGISPEDSLLAEVLPENNREKNIDAIKKGMET